MLTVPLPSLSVPTSLPPGAAVPPVAPGEEEVVVVVVVLWPWPKSEMANATWRPAGKRTHGQGFLGGCCSRHRDACWYTIMSIGAWHTSDLGVSSIRRAWYRAFHWFQMLVPSERKFGLHSTGLARAVRQHRLKNSSSEHINHVSD